MCFYCGKQSCSRYVCMGEGGWEEIQVDEYADVQFCFIGGISCYIAMYCRAQLWVSETLTCPVVVCADYHSDLLLCSRCCWSKGQFTQKQTFSHLPLLQIIWVLFVQVFEESHSDICWRLLFSKHLKLIFKKSPKNNRLKISKCVSICLVYAFWICTYRNLRGNPKK